MARKDPNRRLTTLDASFLYCEKPKEPLHIGACTIYEGHISREALMHTFLERLHLLPRYRQKAVFPPFGLAHPTWEDDPDFDLRNHVEELTLPALADDRVLSEVGGRVFAPLLDRNRPLWKTVLLQGRPDGNTALIWKVHHAVVDGISGVDLIMVLHDLKLAAEPPAPPPTPWQPQPLPDPLTLLQDAMQDWLTGTVQWWTNESLRLLRPAEMTERVRQMTTVMTSSMSALLWPAPRVSFNGPLSGERQFAWAEFSFTEVRAIRAVLGGTVNDVVLAVIAGGLGRYLRAHGHRTEEVELRTMCPVSMRREDEHGALGNLISMIFVPLYVGITDPVERLTAERAAMERLKSQDQAGALYALTSLFNQVPPAWQAVSGQFTVPNLLLNTVATNIPGPQIPLYLAGHKLLALYPLGLLAANIGLFNAIVSYNQKLIISPTVDPQLMPDVWFYTDCLKASFAELRAAAERAAATARLHSSVQEQVAA